MRLVCLIKQQR